MREAKGEQAAQLLAHLKMGEMAEKAEGLLAGSGWLPEPLRTPGRPIACARANRDLAGDDRRRHQPRRWWSAATAWNSFAIMPPTSSSATPAHPARRLQGQSSRTHRGDDRQPRFSRRQASPETEVLLPAGPKIAFAGGLNFNDHHLIWDRLDKVHAKHPNMVLLLHGSSPRGAELIAAKWAVNRKVPQIVFRRDWTKHAKAAPSKRNDEMLETLPIGVMVFPGSGISANLADKARKLSIPVWHVGKDGA